MILFVVAYWRICRRIGYGSCKRVDGFSGVGVLGIASPPMRSNLHVARRATEIILSPVGQRLAVAWTGFVSSLLVIVLTSFNCIATGLGIWAARLEPSPVLDERP